MVDIYWKEIFNQLTSQPQQTAVTLYTKYMKVYSRPLPHDKTLSSNVDIGVGHAIAYLCINRGRLSHAETIKCWLLVVYVFFYACVALITDILFLSFCMARCAFSMSHYYIVHGTMFCSLRYCFINNGIANSSY